MLVFVKSGPDFSRGCAGKGNWHPILATHLSAQIGATVGTLIIAGLAFAQIREMRENRLAQERPQVIVDTDHSKPPLVYVVLRNIGRGVAKDITFEFSAPMEMPEGIENPLVVPVNEQPYFKHGMDYLAPGAEISCLWGSMITLANFLREIVAWTRALR